jgi:hypothetical protein
LADLSSRSLAPTRELREQLTPFEHEHDDEHDVSAEAVAKVEHD